MLAVQVQYRDVLEKERHNRAMERQAQSELQETFRHNVTTEWETERSHKAGENLSLMTIQETSRHNVAVENEAYRHNINVEDETKRHNIVSESIDSQKAAASMMQARASQSQAESAKLQAQTAASKASYDNYLTFQKTQTEKSKTEEAQWNAVSAYQSSRISGVKAEYAQVDAFTNLFQKFIPIVNLGSSK